MHALDWRGMIHYGVSFFMLEKLGAVVGVSNLHIAAMRGEASMSSARRAAPGALTRWQASRRRVRGPRGIGSAAKCKQGSAALVCLKALTVYAPRHASPCSVWR